MIGIRERLDGVTEPVLLSNVLWAGACGLVWVMCFVVVAVAAQLSLLGPIIHNPLNCTMDVLVKECLTARGSLPHICCERLLNRVPPCTPVRASGLDKRSHVWLQPVGNTRDGCAVKYASYSSHLSLHVRPSFRTSVEVLAPLTQGSRLMVLMGHVRGRHALARKKHWCALMRNDRCSGGTNCFGPRRDPRKRNYPQYFGWRAACHSRFVAPRCWSCFAVSV